MKKFMFYLMALNTFVASIVMVVLLALGSSSLPVLVLALRGVMIVGGVALIVKRYLSWVRRGEIAVYYAADAVLAVFNLVFLSAFFPTDVSFFEFAVTGTLVTPVLNAVMILLLLKASGCCVLPQNIGEPVEITVPAQIGGHAAEQK